MKIPKNLLNNAWKIILFPALIGILGSVANHFGYNFESQKAQEPEQLVNPSSTSATAVEGGIHINNYPPQSVTQPNKKNISYIKQPIPIEQKTLLTQNITQEIGDKNECPIQISGSDGNSINCSTNNTDTIEKQENIGRKIETEQYNENNDSNPINCNRSNGTCGDGGTTNINTGN